MEPRPQHLQTRSTLTGLVDEACRRKFEAAWLSSVPQPIEAFLPADETPHYLGTLEELVHIELEFSWKFRQGLPGGAAAPFRKPPRVEDYLDRFPRLRLPSTARRIVEQEYRVRRSFAEHPSAKEYHSRFPELYPDEASAEHLESPPEPGGLPQFPGYSLQRELGRGGMGIVYEALQIDLKRPVALKVMRAGNHAAEEEIARFHTEAESVARLQHPNIVEIYEIGSADGNPYLSLEFVDGGTLADTIASRPQPPRDAANRVRQLAAAAECAHQSGVIHRDLKPSNVLLTASGIPKISDFGLARQMEAETPPHTHGGSAWHTQLHGTGAGRRPPPGHWPGDRCLCSRGDSLRTPDGAPTVPRRDAHRDPTAGPGGRPDLSESTATRSSTRPCHHQSKSSRERAGPPLPKRRRARRRSGTLSRRKADSGATGQPRLADLEVDPATPRRGHGTRRDHPGRGQPPSGRTLVPGSPGEVPRTGDGTEERRAGEFPAGAAGGGPDADASGRGASGQRASNGRRHAATSGGRSRFLQRLSRGTWRRPGSSA